MAKHSLPSVDKLFSQSWDTFKSNIPKLFIFTLAITGISIAFWILVFGLGVLLAFATGLFTLFTHYGVSAWINIPLSLYILAGIYLVVILAGLICIAMVGSIVPILIVSQNTKTVSFSQNIKASFPLVLPLLLTELLVSIILFGGVFILVFPAVVFSFFIIFVKYEVILNKQKYLSAIKRSVYIVSKHFSEILVRVLLYALIYILISVFIPNVLTKVGQNSGVLIRILSFILNVMLGWFGICFGVTLYKQAHVGLSKKEAGNITWIWVVSFLGWVVFFLAVFAGFKFMQSDIARSLWQKFSSDNNYSNFLEMIQDRKTPYGLPSGTQEL